MLLRLQSKSCSSVYVRSFRARENASLVKLAQSKNTISTAVANMTLYVDGPFNCCSEGCKDESDP